MVQLFLYNNFSGNISRIFCYTPGRWRYCSRWIPNFPHCGPDLGTRKSRMVCICKKFFLHKINCSFTKYVLYSFCLHYRYGQLTAGLTQDNVKAVQEVFKLCEQRQAAKRSKSIEQAGGKYKKFAIKISFYTESWLEKFIQIFFFFIQMKNECMHAY